MLMETGGGLYKARSFFDSDPFLLYNADIITDLDLRKLYNYHIERKAIATLAVRKRPGNRFFLINRVGVLRGWISRATGENIVCGGNEEELSEIAFSGIHIIDPSIFDYMHKGVFTMTNLYLRLASSRNIQTFTCNDGYWFDIGTPEKLEEARRYLK
jgi:NDP-sugar pyrophosphorylase family protein